MYCYLKPQAHKDQIINKSQDFGKYYCSSDNQARTQKFKWGGANKNRVSIFKYL